jgi:hypothetical protein
MFTLEPLAKPAAESAKPADAAPPPGLLPAVPYGRYTDPHFFEPEIDRMIGPARIDAELRLPDVLQSYRTI